MTEDLLNNYISVWLVHPYAGSPEGAHALESLQQLMARDVTYEDVPSGMVFRGHSGIAEMCAAAHTWSADLSIQVTSRQTNGTYFAFETEAAGTHTGEMGPMAATGRSFSFRGVSVGRVSSDGLVVEQRDYWDMMSFLGQIGVVRPLT